MGVINVEALPKERIGRTIRAVLAIARRVAIRDVSSCFLDEPAEVLLAGLT